MAIDADFAKVLEEIQEGEKISGKNFLALIINQCFVPFSMGAHFALSVYSSLFQSQTDEEKSWLDSVALYGKVASFLTISGVSIIDFYEKLRTTYQIKSAASKASTNISLRTAFSEASPPDTSADLIFWLKSANQARDELINELKTKNKNINDTEKKVILNKLKEISNQYRKLFFKALRLQLQSDRSKSIVDEIVRKLNLTLLTGSFASWSALTGSSLALSVIRKIIPTDTTMSVLNGGYIFGKLLNTIPGTGFFDKPIEFTQEEAATLNEILGTGPVDQSLIKAVREFFQGDLTAEEQTTLDLAEAQQVTAGSSSTPSTAGPSHFTDKDQLISKQTPPSSPKNN
jgi:hypothetical protein